MIGKQGLSSSLCKCADLIESLFKTFHGLRNRSFSDVQWWISGGSWGKQGESICPFEG
jgi:hypothetical protein